MENKQCQKCKQHLPLTEFHKDRTNNDGLSILLDVLLVIKISRNG
jgi:hypothetical protein